MRSGRNDVAINILMKRPGGSNYFPFHYLNFMLGMAKLHRLDPDADLYLKSYLRQFKGRKLHQRSLSETRMESAC
jgi:hypothetical protein